jgi:hypothetical protein
MEKRYSLYTYQHKIQAFRIEESVQMNLVSTALLYVIE